jgi:hypothetical protein
MKNGGTMPEDRNSTCTDVQHQSVACLPSDVLTDDLIRLLEDFEGSMRFVPDWSDEPFRRAA